MFSSSLKITPEMAEHMACIAYYKLSDELKKSSAEPDGYKAWLKNWERTLRPNGQADRALND